MSRFIGGLRPQIQTALSQFDPLTVAEAHRQAVAFETQFRSSSSWGASALRNRSGAHGIVETTQSASTKKGVDLTTSRAHQQSRDDKNSEDLGMRRSTRPNSLRCFSCGEAGHIQTACPNKSRCGLLADKAHWESNALFDDDAYEDEDELQVDQLEGDKGTLLVARRVFGSGWNRRTMAVIESVSVNLHNQWENLSICD